ncbi:MAG: large-conductance mechanosensitive channel protein MscL [Anaerolineales bacterium]|nr:large-conductance mechanosensitive channel protein MscL [Anaerolineales bacterium]
MLQEFQKFISKGNVLDLAVGVIIGGAFGAIVGSLVNDIIMPLIGLILGGIDFSGLAITVGSATVTYGNFIQAVVNFLIIAFVIFQIVQIANKLNPPPPPPPAPGPTPDQKLLAEIRDLLAKSK